MPMPMPDHDPATLPTEREWLVAYNDQDIINGLVEGYTRLDEFDNVWHDPATTEAEKLNGTTQEIQEKLLVAGETPDGIIAQSELEAISLAKVGEYLKFLNSATHSTGASHFVHNKQAIDKKVRKQKNLDTANPEDVAAYDNLLHRVTVRTTLDHLSLDSQGDPRVYTSSDEYNQARDRVTAVVNEAQNAPFYQNMSPSEKLNWRNNIINTFESTAVDEEANTAATEAAAEAARAATLSTAELDLATQRRLLASDAVKTSRTFGSLRILKRRGERRRSKERYLGAAETVRQTQIENEIANGDIPNTPEAIIIRNSQLEAKEDSLRIAEVGVSMQNDGLRQRADGSTNDINAGSRYYRTVLRAAKGWRNLPWWGKSLTTAAIGVAGAGAAFFGGPVLVIAPVVTALRSAPAINALRTKEESMSEHKRWKKLGHRTEKLGKRVVKAVRGTTPEEVVKSSRRATEKEINADFRGERIRTTRKLIGRVLVTAVLGKGAAYAGEYISDHAEGIRDGLGDIGSWFGDAADKVHEWLPGDYLAKKDIDLQSLLSGGKIRPDTPEWDAAVNMLQSHQASGRNADHLTRLLPGFDDPKLVDNMADVKEQMRAIYESWSPEKRFAWGHFLESNAGEKWQQMADLRGPEVVRDAIGRVVEAQSQDPIHIQQMDAVTQLARNFPNSPNITYELGRLQSVLPGRNDIFDNGGIFSTPEYIANYNPNVAEQMNGFLGHLQSIIGGGNQAAIDQVVNNPDTYLVTGHDGFLASQLGELKGKTGGDLVAAISSLKNRYGF